MDLGDRLVEAVARVRQNDQSLGLAGPLEDELGALRGHNVVFSAVNEQERTRRQAIHPTRASTLSRQRGYPDAGWRCRAGLDRHRASERKADEHDPLDPPLDEKLDPRKRVLNRCLQVA